jgi:hypothetical protein
VSWQTVSKQKEDQEKRWRENIKDTLQQHGWFNYERRNKTSRSKIPQNTRALDKWGAAAPAKSGNRVKERRPRVAKMWKRGIVTGHL